MNDARLTKAALESMNLGGHSKVFRYNTAAEYDSARRNAYHIRQRYPRGDGSKYVIHCSAKAMVITVALEAV